MPGRSRRTRSSALQSRQSGITRGGSTAAAGRLSRKRRPYRNAILAQDGRLLLLELLFRKDALRLELAQAFELGELVVHAVSRSRRRGGAICAGCSAPACCAGSPYFFACRRSTAFLVAVAVPATTAVLAIIPRSLGIFAPLLDAEFCERVVYHRTGNAEGHRDLAAGRGNA